MPSYEVRWVDAFTSTPLEGNACAVVLDARGLDDAAMLAIARETNLSETAFVFPPRDDGADRDVRYFTPVRELPMAGHPTIATTHALVETGALGAARDAVRLRMPAGIVPVEIRRDGARIVYAMSQAAPAFGRSHDRRWAAAALRLDDADLLAGTLPRTVSTGTPQLIVALASGDALDRCDPDRRRLFAADRDYFSVHVFALGPPGGGVGFNARHFAEFGDVIEDPFTGSGTGNAAAYCARYELIAERVYDVRQGMHVRRPGRARVELGGEPPERLGRIVVAGEAVTVMTATLRLP